MKSINFMSEMDKLVVHYFNKVDPFEIGDKVVPASFTRGTPDNLSISEIWSNLGDVVMPLIVISRDSESFSLHNEKNVPAHDGTRITVNRTVRNKYINSDEPNINVETYTYNPPVYFGLKYRITFFCEYLKHSTEFITQFLDRLNQGYVKIESDKFESIFFDTIWVFRDSLNTEDNFSETTESKRLIKVTTTIDGDGYYISEASQKIEREVSKSVLKGYLS